MSDNKMTTNQSAQRKYKALFKLLTMVSIALVCLAGCAPQFPKEVDVGNRAAICDYTWREAAPILSKKYKIQISQADTGNDYYFSPDVVPGIFTMLSGKYEQKSGTIRCLYGWEDNVTDHDTTYTYHRIIKYNAALLVDVVFSDIGPVNGQWTTAMAPIIVSDTLISKISTKKYEAEKEEEEVEKNKRIDEMVKLLADKLNNEFPGADCSLKDDNLACEHPDLIP